MLRHAFASPKLAALARRLELDRWAVVGVLEHLWYFTATQAPRGDIGRWSDEEIAGGIDWKGDATALVEALVASRWLDRCAQHRLLVHDWKDHADGTVKRSPVVQNQGFAKLVAQPASETHAAHMRDTCGTHDSLSLSQSPEPEPVPHTEKVADATAAGAAVVPLGNPSKREALKRAPGKAPGQEAVAIFCEEFKAARGVNPAVPPKDARALHDLHRQIGPERLRAAARVYMHLADDFVRKALFAPAVFVARITQCDETAQMRAPPVNGHAGPAEDEAETLRRWREVEKARLENR